MNSFTQTAVDNPARNPAFAAKSDTFFERFCLPCNNHAGINEVRPAGDYSMSVWSGAETLRGESP